MKYVLYNPLANNNHGAQNAMSVMHLDKDAEYIFKDITSYKNINTFLSSIDEYDEVIISGGDGTLNVFINQLGKNIPKNNLYYYPAGSGNDFMHDVCENPNEKLVKINDYIKDLPIVEVNGKYYYFINGIGYGIDGYCCEERDNIQAKSTKKINYTLIALKGLLYKFSPRNAKVTVDGITREYKNVWLSPTMNGRYFGGGMQIAPMQNRLNDKHTVSSMVISHGNRLKVLLAFPSIFKGEHIVKYKKLIDTHQGNEVSVEFDRPTALQIDGETVRHVFKYTVYSGNAKKKITMQDNKTNMSLV